MEKIVGNNIEIIGHEVLFNKVIRKMVSEKIIFRYIPTQSENP